MFALLSSERCEKREQNDLFFQFSAANFQNESIISWFISSREPKWRDKLRFYRWFKLVGGIVRNYQRERFHRKREIAVKDYIPNPWEEGKRGGIQCPIIGKSPTNEHCRKCQRCLNVQSSPGWRGATTTKRERRDFLDVSWLTRPPFANLWSRLVDVDIKDRSPDSTFLTCQLPRTDFSHFPNYR